MASEIHILAIISPNPGKVDRVIELLQGVSEFVKEKEPGTLKYEINRQVNHKSGVEEVIILETYQSKEALGAHGSSKKIKELGKILQEEGLMAAPTQLKFVKPVGGFTSRM